MSFSPMISRAVHLRTVRIDELLAEDVEHATLELSKLPHLHTLFVGRVCAPDASRRRMLGAGTRDMVVRQWAPLGRLHAVRHLTVRVPGKMQARSVSGLARAVSTLDSLRELHLLDFGGNALPVNFQRLIGITALEIATDDLDGIQDLTSLRALTAIVPSSRPFVGDHVSAVLAHIRHLTRLQLLVPAIAWPRMGTLGHMTALRELITAVDPSLEWSPPCDVCQGPRYTFLVRAVSSDPPAELRELTIGACALAGACERLGGWRAVANVLSNVKGCVWSVWGGRCVPIAADKGADEMTRSLSLLRS